MSNAPIPPDALQPNSGREDRRRRRRPYLIAAIAATVLCAAALVWLSDRWALSRPLAALPQPAVSFVSADGTPIARQGDYKEDPVSIDEVPQHLLDALLAMEDRRFYSHFGLDLIGIARAGLRNWRSGAIREGGSTITQQLAKIAFLTPERTYARKLQEAMIALWLELRLSKDEILVRYLSSAYFGDGAYGLRAAARHYFDKDVRELTLPESILLVATLRAPSRLTPTRHLQAAQARARLVIGAMIAAGKLSEAEAEALEPAEPTGAHAAAPLGTHFADWLAATALPELPAGHGEVRLTTTLDDGLQALAVRAIERAFEGEAARLGVGEAALVAMRTDGRVVAMVGGRDYRTSEFNRATQALRQPGSAFKTFVYLAALRDGASPQSVVPDEPYTFDGWTPRNFDGRYRGPVTLTQAFASSLNAVAVEVSEYVGRRHVIAAARDLGLSGELRDTPSLALGASEVTLLELTASYAAIAAGRYPVRPWGLADSDARSDRDQQPLREARSMRGLLRTVVERGTGRGARLPVPAFGKTGTSQKFRDAWFVGYAGDLVVGVWVGNDDNAPMRRVTGGALPARIWRDFMTGALDSEAVHLARIEEPDWLDDNPFERRRSDRRPPPRGSFSRMLREFGFR